MSTPEDESLAALAGTVPPLPLSGDHFEFQFTTAVALTHCFFFPPGEGWSLVQVLPSFMTVSKSYYDQSGGGQSVTRDSQEPLLILVWARRR